MNNQPEILGAPHNGSARIIDAANAPDRWGNTLSAEQAGAILDCSAQKIRGMCQRGELKAHKDHTKRGTQWRIERTGLLAPKEAEDPMAMVGAMMDGRDLAALVRMLAEGHQTDRQTIAEQLKRIEQLHEENARIREQYAAAEAKAALALKLIQAPLTVEPPKPKPWWRFW